MKKLWDFICPRCGLFEAWSDQSDVKCPDCGSVSHRRIGSRGVLLSFKDPGFPRAHRMWADQHERAGRVDSMWSEE